MPVKMKVLSNWDDLALTLPTQPENVRDQATAIRHATHHGRLEESQVGREIRIRTPPQAFAHSFTLPTVGCTPPTSAKLVKFD
jgi:hypothetical protein